MVYKMFSWLWMVLATMSYGSEHLPLALFRRVSERLCTKGTTTELMNRN